MQDSFFEDKILREKIQYFNKEKSVVQNRDIFWWWYTHGWKVKGKMHLILEKYSPVQILLFRDILVFSKIYPFFITMSEKSIKTNLGEGTRWNSVPKEIHIHPIIYFNFVQIVIKFTRNHHFYNANKTLSKSTQIS